MVIHPYIGLHAGTQLKPLQCSLIMHGVSINVTNNEGDTLVHRASRWNSTEAIAMLINHGASINIMNNRGETPVHYAASENLTEVIAILIKHGASINITNDRGDKPINQARRYGKETAVRMLEQL